jgi:TonB family protein
MKKSLSINVLATRTTALAAVVAATAAVSLSGCSKTEAPKAKNAVPMVGQGPQEEPSAPRKIVDYMAGLKNIKDESKSVTKEEMVRSSQQVVASAESAKAAAKPSEPAKPVVAEPAKPAPAPVTTASAPPPAPSAATIPASKTAPGDNVVAKAAPSSAPTPAMTAATPISREAPDFPREAIRTGVDAGAVRARLSIDAAGNVTNVQIVEARPARVFDRSVRETLARWKFNAGSDGRSYDTEVEFKR